MSREGILRSAILNAIFAQSGSGEEEDVGDEEPAPLEIISYRMGK